MGLDMRLEGQLNSYRMPQRVSSALSSAISEMNGFALESMMYELAYWRKANAVHNWFSQNIQGGVENCGRYMVSDEMLENLKQDCVSVLEDNELAEQLMPSCSGFFFGSTDYDEGYIEDLKYTVEVINKIQESPFYQQGLLDVFYSADW